MICLFCSMPVPLNHFVRFSFLCNQKRFYIAHWKCLEQAEIDNVLDITGSQSISGKTEDGE